jgi:hypothetical protein
MMGDPRTCESAFRVAVPQFVGGLEVAEVINYRPARPGEYAAAIAVCQWAGGEWSSHVVVFAHDRPEDDPDRWSLSAGTHHPTRDAVTRHARVRRP